MIIEQLLKTIAMKTIESELSELQFQTMKSGYTALCTLVLQHRYCLERLLAFNREINVYLTMRTWEKWIDFQAMVHKFEPALIEAALFLRDSDEVIARNDYLQAELIAYAQSAILEMKSCNVKILTSKFYALLKASEIQVTKAQSARLMAQIKAENIAHHIKSVTKAGYVENGDGTIIDVNSHLMWMQCAEGQEGLFCEGQVLQFSWEAAMSVPLRLNSRGGFAGYSDWRLPTLLELQSLVRIDERPTICSEAFPNAPANLFWSSTLFNEGGSNACNVYFGSGSSGANHRDNAYSVRLVRTILPISSSDIDL